MEIATALQDRFKEPIDWKKSSDVQNKMLRDAVAQETARAVDLHPEAKGWYDENIKLTVDVLKELDPDISKPENDFIFKILLAATSDGNKVRPQFLQSWDEYTNWKNTGKISGQFVSGDRVSNIRKNLFKVEAMIQAVGWEKVRDFLTKKGTVSEIREALVKDFGLTKQEAAKIGTSELADEVVPYAIVLGPKLGSFFNNLYGDFSSVTMDRWFMRTMGRLTGTQVDTSAFKKVRSLRATLRESISKLTSSEKEFLKISSDKIKGDNIDAAAKSISTRFAKKETRDRAAQLESEGRPFMEEVRKRSNALKKIQSPLVEAPLNGRHRRWIRQRIAEVQGELKSRGIELENADLQAVLWYLEKELYDKLNYRAKPGDSDYASAAAHLYERVVGQPSSVYAGATGRIRAVGGGGSDVAMGTTNPAEARAAVGEQRYMPASDDIRFMPDYSGEHKAPQRDYGAPLDNLKGVYPDDVYGPNAAQYYGHSSGDATDKAAARIIQATKGKPNALVKVFRAIPKSIQSNEINPGDWITTIKSYAVDHGEGPLGGDYKILEKTVPAGDLYTNGDSIFEFGYDPKFMPSPDSAMPGAYSFPGGYRALPGKAKGSLRLYGPAGSLIGIASSLDEAQRILRRKGNR
jgi:hypothetical protein